ncbi:MAG: hypothetical protein Q4A83_05070 [Bacillota bacterium]|nr:hypothetical protein [Bacillota bacterium]
MDEILEYKCPCCGGFIRFDSRAQKMICPYCDTEFDVESLKKYDEELKNDRPDSMDWQSSGGVEWQEGESGDMRIYACKACGGEIIADLTTAASACPYCGNPVIMTGQLTGELRPDLVIPFKLDKEAAKAALKKHLEGKKLLPKVFKSENHIDEIKGVYVPFWLFDTETQARIRYKATAVRMWSDADYNYTETRFYNVVRSGTLDFENVPADGSSKMADDLMESIEPFDFSEAVDFQTAYLSGYLADRYDVTAEESVERVNARMKKSTEETFRETVSYPYNTLVPESSSVEFSQGRAKYALYPVWILNTSWKGEKYTFAMNGQTGKFVGNLPVDKGIFWRWFAGITAGASAAIYGFAWLISLL